MKRYMIASVVVVLIVITGVAVALAGSPKYHAWCRQGWNHRGPFGYIARELDLSGTQKSQIKSIWQAERPTISSLVREFAAEGKEMDAATAQGHLDENQVQEIANRQGATIAKLLVEKERLRSQIYTTVLNPAQRTKADALETRWHSRLYRMADRLERGGSHGPSD